MISTDMVSNVRSGNVTVWPGASRDSVPRSTSSGSPPSKRTSTPVMKRFRAPVVDWVSVTWSVVTGSARLSSMRSPRASENAAVRQAVSRSPSTARAGRSSLVKVMGLP